MSCNALRMRERVGNRTMEHRLRNTPKFGEFSMTHGVRSTRSFTDITRNYPRASGKLDCLWYAAARRRAITILLSLLFCTRPM